MHSIATFIREAAEHDFGQAYEIYPRAITVRWLKSMGLGRVFRERFRGSRVEVIRTAFPDELARGLLHEQDFISDPLVDLSQALGPLSLVPVSEEGKATLEGVTYKFPPIIKFIAKLGKLSHDLNRPLPQAFATREYGGAYDANKVLLWIFPLVEPTPGEKEIDIGGALRSAGHDRYRCFKRFDTRYFIHFFSVRDARILLQQWQLPVEDWDTLPKEDQQQFVDYLNFFGARRLKQYLLWATRLVGVKGAVNFMLSAIDPATAFVFSEVNE